MNSVDVQHGPMLKKLFRFEEAWAKVDGCEEIIYKAWATRLEGSPMFHVCKNIKECRKHSLVNLMVILFPLEN